MFPVHQTNTPVISPCIFPSYRIHQPSREHAPLPLLASPCSPPPHRAAPYSAALRAHMGPAAAVSTPAPHGTHQPVHTATVLAQPALPTATPCRLGVLRAPRLPGSMRPRHSDA
ncbi:hypothetical protein B0H10DRAFT_1975419 [Mycena sp. CBHHK59/15]|nr:hypothetical protein B0H10DRAFT_1975419 [Mycena sp. CBHHK59/15]